MVHDSLDLFTPRSRFTATGTYWTERPDSADMGGIKFNYEYVDPMSKTYRILFGNIQTDEAGNTTIRTNDNLGFKDGQWVMTADGQLFQIEQVAKDFADAPKQALRFFGTPLMTEFVLRLITVPNPWGAV